MIYLYPERGHERLAIDLEELDRQITWLHEQTMRDENEGIWNLLESIRELGKSDDAGDRKDRIDTNEQSKVVPTKTHWEDDIEFPADDWKYEVANGDTRLGYGEWVGHQRNAKKKEP